MSGFVERTPDEMWNAELVFAAVLNTLEELERLSEVDPQAQGKVTNLRGQAVAITALSAAFFELSNNSTSTGMASIAAATFVFFGDNADRIMELMVKAHGYEAIIDSLVKFTPEIGEPL